MLAVKTSIMNTQNFTPSLQWIRH